MGNLRRTPQFLNFAVTKHQQAIGTRGGQRQIVRDKQHGGAGVAAQFIEQIENARLHRDVQRAGGLIGDDKRGLERQRNGDQHPLLHTARELVRVLLRPQRRFAQADTRKQRYHFSVTRASPQPGVKL